MIVDFVSKELSAALLSFLESDSIPWVFSTEGVKELGTEGYYDSPQFTYTIVEGDYIGNVSPVVQELWKFIYKAHPEEFKNFVSISRIKCNMITRGIDDTPHVPHLDRYTPHIVIVYYVNNSDGDTYIYDQEGSVSAITPEQGKYVIFDGSLKHCGSSPLKQNHRLVINFNC